MGGNPAAPPGASSVRPMDDSNSNPLSPLAAVGDGRPALAVDPWRVAPAALSSASGGGGEGEGGGGGGWALSEEITAEVHET